MPNLGDIARASEVGYKGRALFVWVACPDCGVARWRPLHNEVTRCWKCSANKRERMLKPITFTGTGEPAVGDTATAAAIGAAGRGIHVYAACLECGSTRWTRWRQRDTLCSSCTAKLNSVRSGEKHPKWKGGRKRSRGYVYVPILSTDPFFVMATRRYKDHGIVAEHRLVMACSIGRPLRADEVVHHINGTKDDNRRENLRLLNEHDHHSALVAQELQDRVRDLESRVTLLEAENTALEASLQKVGDSGTSSELNLRRYNTLGDLPDKQVEGIVHAP